MKTETQTKILTDIRSILEDMREFSKPTFTGVPMPPPLEVVPPRKKLVLEAFPEFVGKPMEVLHKHLQENYKDRLVDADFVMTSELPKEQEVWQYCFKTFVRISDGRWDVPDFDRDGGEWDRIADWLGNAWYSDGRVVLFEL